MDNTNFRIHCGLIFFLALWSGLTLPIYAQIEFTEHPITTGLVGAVDVLTVDVDIDGDVDLLVAAQDANQIIWLENDGDANFTASIVAENLAGAADIAVADMDYDGDPDLLAAVRDANTVLWWRNFGNGAFTTPAVISDTLYSARTVFPVDLDLDGDMDILTGAQNEDSGVVDIIWWVNLGIENFYPVEIDLNFNSVEQVTAMDFNRDGLVDILGAAAGSLNDIKWWRNEGDNTFRELSIETLFRGVREYQALDLDGDTDLDVIATAFDDNEIRWWRNDGTERFDEFTITDSLLGATSVYSVDLDGDSDWDIVAAGYNQNTIRWWENNGDMTFNEIVLSNTFTEARKVTAADIDRDGDPDIVGIGTAGQVTWWESSYNPPIPSMVVSPLVLDYGQVYLGESETLEFTITNRGYADLIISEVTIDEPFTLEAEVPITVAPGNNVALAVTLAPEEEIDYTGQITLISNDEDDSPTQILLIGNGNDGEPDWEEIYLTENDLLRARAVRTDDFTWDGFPDVIVGGFYGVTGWINDGTGEAFDPFPLPFPPPPYPLPPFLEAWDVADLKIADADKDGFLDIYGVSYISNDVILWEDVPFTLSYVQNTLDGRFEDSQAIDTGDLDGDGDMDVVSTSTNTHTLAWWERLPDGRHRKHVLSTSELNCIDAKITDLNGDGRMDIISVSRGYDNLVAWFGNGYGSFSRQELDTGVGGLQAITINDVDNDGDADLLGAAYQTDRFLWWENDGSGMMTRHTLDTPAYDGAYDVAVKDLDNDGFKDIIGVAYIGRSIGWWQNDGAQNFTYKSISSALSGPQSVQVEDMDQDGDWDVLAALYDGNNLVMWKNDLNPEVPNIIRAPQTINFGEVNLGEGLVAAFFVGNAGTEPLNITGIQVNEPFAANFTPLTLYPGEQDTILVSFIPTTEGYVEETLTIISDDPDEPEMPVLLVGATSYRWHRMDLITNTTQTATLASADVNRDGEVDLISGGVGGISWWQNTGDEVFEAHLIATGIDSIIEMKVLNLDNTPGVDIIAAIAGEDAISWWQNDGNGTFTEHSVVTNAGGVTDFTLADMDGDGDSDLVLAAATAGTVTWWANDGNANFDLAGTIVIEAEGVNTVQVSDVDSDGDPDVLITIGETGRFSWWENIGDGNFLNTPIATNLQGGSSIITKDWDTDGDMDLVTGATDFQLALWENDGDQTFGRTFIDDVRAVDLLLGDVDRDYDQDLIGTVPDSNGIYWWEYERVSPDQFLLTRQIVTKTFEGIKAVHLVDLDRDRDMDIVATSTTGNRITWWENRFYLTDVEIDPFENELVVPGAPVLHQNYPNPFNPRTTIRFDLPQESTVTLNIYDVSGRLIRQLIAPDQEQIPGRYSVVWDGTDERGQHVRSGMYLYVLQTGTFQDVKRMILLK